MCLIFEQYLTLSPQKNKSRINQEDMFIVPDVTRWLQRFSFWPELCIQTNISCHLYNYDFKTINKFIL